VVVSKVPPGFISAASQWGSSEGDTSQHVCQNMGQPFLGQKQLSAHMIRRWDSLVPGGTKAKGAQSRTQRARTVLVEDLKVSMVRGSNVRRTDVLRVCLNTVTAGDRCDIYHFYLKRKERLAIRAVWHRTVWPNVTSVCEKYITSLFSSEKNIPFAIKPNGGHAVAYWLRHYVTGRKVAGSRPDEVNEFFQFT
jgi:hypothetical protein